MFISLISRGNMFQKVGPETRKLRGPKVIVLMMIDTIQISWAGNVIINFISPGLGMIDGCVLSLWGGKDIK